MSDDMRGMATDTPIGTRIRKRRQELRLTQEELAGRVGVDRASVGNWESGRHFPQRYQGALESVLGISLDEDGRFRPVSPELRRLIADTLPGDIEAQRRVIGLLEGTLSWPDTDGSQADEQRSAR